MGVQKSFCLTMEKEFTNDTLAYVCQEFGIEQHFTSPYTPRSNGKTENFNKHPYEDWELKPSSIGRAAKFVNHPDNLPDIDFSVDKPSDNQTGTKPKYNLRRAIKAPTKLKL